MDELIKTNYPILPNEYAFRLISSDQLGLHINYKVCRIHNNPMIFLAGRVKCRDR